MAFAFVLHNECGLGGLTISTLSAAKTRFSPQYKIISRKRRPDSSADLKKSVSMHGSRLQTLTSPVLHSLTSPSLTPHTHTHMYVYTHMYIYESWETTFTLSKLWSASFWARMENEISFQLWFFSLGGIYQPTEGGIKV